MNFNELSPHERMLFMAKIYHNIWYSNSRYFVLESILKNWDEIPVKEAKFFNEIESNDNDNFEKII